MTFGLDFTDAPDADLAVWVCIINLQVKHPSLPQGFNSPVGPSSLESGDALAFCMPFSASEGKSYSGVLETR